MSNKILITGRPAGFGLMLVNNLRQSGFNMGGTSREPEKQLRVKF